MKRYGRLFFWVIGFVFLSGFFTYSPAAGTPQQPEACINLLEDPGFEAYTPNPYWTEYTLFGGTPLCTVFDCGSFGTGPHSGQVWAWFGSGYVANGKASLSQTITIPEGEAILSFHLAVQAPDGGGSDDQFTVTIDFTPVFLTDATQAGDYPEYTLVTVDVSGYADGLTHEISFSSDIFGDIVGFHLDDVALCGGNVEPFNGPQVFLPITISPPWVTEAPTLETWSVPEYTLRWNPVEGAVTYIVEEDTEWDFASPTVVYEGPETSWKATWRPNESYIYRVSGKNVRGPGPWSNEVWAYYEGAFATADAGIASGDSNTNFGDSYGFVVGYFSPTCPVDSPTSTGDNRGLLFFDTAGVPVNLGFTKVELRVYLYDICYLDTLEGFARTITAYRVTSPWDEGTVNWGNAPSIQESIGSVDIEISSDSIYSYHVIDITALARDWLNGSKPNYGLMLRSIESGAGFMFNAREDYDAPHLAITFDAGDTASVQAALERIPPSERQCVIAAPGEMWCVLKAK